MSVIVCRVVEFSDEPAGLMLYEGVFFSHSQAESYLIAHSHSVRHDNVLHHHKCTSLFNPQCKLLSDIDYLLLWCNLLKVSNVREVSVLLWLIMR